MEIKLFSYPDSRFSANTYICYNEDKEALIIDPGIEDENIIDFIIDNNLNLKAILLTHAHFDHIRGLTRLLKEFSVNVYLHSNDLELLRNPYLNLSHYMDDNDYRSEIEPILIKDDDRLALLKGENIIVIHTPFHTKGCVCYYFSISKVLFSGDTLFNNSIGRFDLPTSTPQDIKSSLNNLFILPDEVIVYPGHGPITSIMMEKFNNKEI